VFLYRDLIPERFWGGETIKPGAFGCALSHLAAWRRMLADGAEAALICEDDARLIADPASARPDGPFDVVFANRRTADWLAAAGAEGFLSAAEVVAALDAPPSPPGADAYLVSRRGAERLISAVEETGVVAGIDWLILSRGLPAEAAAWEEIAALDRDAASARGISVFVAPKSVAEAAGGASVIAHSETAPLDALRAAAPTFDFDLPPAFAADPVATDWAAGRFHEAPALELAFRWFPRGGLFVDVGAHIGNHTLFMLRHAGAARAVAFEPHARAGAALKAVLEASGLADRVDLSHLGFGLAEEAGRREAKGGRRAGYAQRLRPGFDEAVRVRAGDALLRGEAPAMIKIDVGGEEREVLKGLRKTVKRARPLLLIDLTRPKSTKARPLLERLGYAEAEQVEWSEGETRRRTAIFRAVAA
ncbi:MAG: FkbM family methyltransferase, partial [Pseudomonadota bacterium]